MSSNQEFILLMFIGFLAISKGQECMVTVEGTSDVKPCIFPWKFNGNDYAGCIPDPDDSDGKLYCITEKLEDGINAGLGQWGYCPDSCSELKSKPLLEHASFGDQSCRTLDHDPPNMEVSKYLRKNTPCVFPFEYKKKTYNRCTKDHSENLNGRPWCATKTNPRNQLVPVNVFGSWDIDIDGKANVGICEHECLAGAQSLLSPIAFQMVAQVSWSDSSLNLLAKEYCNLPSNNARRSILLDPLVSAELAEKILEVSTDCGEFMDVINEVVQAKIDTLCNSECQNQKMKALEMAQKAEERVVQKYDDDIESNEVIINRLSQTSQALLKIKKSITDYNINRDNERFKQKVESDLEELKTKIGSETFGEVKKAVEAAKSTSSIDTSKLEAAINDNEIEETKMNRHQSKLKNAKEKAERLFTNVKSGIKGMSKSDALAKTAGAMGDVASAVSKFVAGDALSVVGGVLDVANAISSFLPPPANLVTSTMSGIFNMFTAGPSKEDLVIKEIGKVRDDIKNGFEDQKIFIKNEFEDQKNFIKNEFEDQEIFIKNGFEDQKIFIRQQFTAQSIEIKQMFNDQNLLKAHATSLDILDTLKTKHVFLDSIQNEGVPNIEVLQNIDSNINLLELSKGTTTLRHLFENECKYPFKFQAGKRELKPYCRPLIYSLTLIETYTSLIATSLINLLENTHLDALNTGYKNANSINRNNIRIWFDKMFSKDQFETCAILGDDEIFPWTNFKNRQEVLVFLNASLSGTDWTDFRCKPWKLVVAIGAPPSSSTKTEVLDLENKNNLCNAPPFPIEFNGATGGAVNESTALICGGYNGERMLQECYMMLQDGSYQAVVNLKVPRTHASSVTYDDDLLVFGGLNDSKTLNTIERVSLKTKSVAQLIELPFTFKSGCVLKYSTKNVILIAGSQDGWLERSSTWTSSIEDLNNWNQGPELKQERSFHACAFLPILNVGFVAGGRVGGLGGLGSTELIDLTEQSVVQGPQLPFTLYSHNLVNHPVDPNTLILTGGDKSDGEYSGKILTITCVSTTQCTNWEEIGTLSVPRGFHISFFISSDFNCTKT